MAMMTMRMKYNYNYTMDVSGAIRFFVNSNTYVRTVHILFIEIIDTVYDVNKSYSEAKLSQNINEFIEYVRTYVCYKRDHVRTYVHTYIRIY